jgi:hypothetical protein
MHDAREATVARWLHECVGAHRWNFQSASESMRIVAREENNLARAQLDWSIGAGLQKQASGDDAVVGNHMLRSFEKRPAIFGRDPGRYAPRRTELRIQKDPAGQSDDAKNIRESIQAAIR